MIDEKERPAPSSIESEEKVLGALMYNPDIVSDILAIVKPEHMYKHSNKVILEAITHLHNNDSPIDVVSVSEHMRDVDTLKQAGGRKYINDLALSVITTVNMEHYAKKIKQKAVLRNVIATGSKMINLGYNSTDYSETIAQVESIIDSIDSAPDSGDIESINDITVKTLSLIEERYENEGELSGVPSGFYDLDEMTTGFQKSDLIILAARPSQGKTALSLNIAGHLALDNNMPTAFFSLEMSKEQLVQRIMCFKSGIDSQSLRTGKLTEHQWHKLHKASAEIRKSKLFIDDTPAISVNEIKSKARKIKSKHPELAMIIIDYIQLMSGNTKTESRVQEVSAISRGLKGLARELDVPVIALSQLSRAVEQRQNKRPMLSDLRESGSIEQDADIVMFIYRDEYYYPERIENNGEAELIVAKQRNGPVGTVNLLFLKHFTKFENKMR